MIVHNLDSWRLCHVSRRLGKCSHFTEEDVPSCPSPLPIPPASVSIKQTSQWPRQAGSRSWLLLWCPRQADSLASADELCERPCLQPGCQDRGPHGSLSSGQGSSGWFPSVRFCSRSFRCSCPPPPTPGGCSPCSDRLITRNRREALAGSRAADLMHWMGLGTQ